MDLFARPSCPFLAVGISLRALVTLYRSTNDETSEAGLLRKPFRNTHLNGG